jgi:hypothetical protein
MQALLESHFESHLAGWMREGGREREREGGVLEGGRVGE